MTFLLLWMNKRKCLHCSFLYKNGIQKPRAVKLQKRQKKHHKSTIKEVHMIYMHYSKSFEFIQLLYMKKTGHNFCIYSKLCRTNEDI